MTIAELLRYSEYLWYAGAIRVNKHTDIHVCHALCIIRNASIQTLLCCLIGEDFYFTFIYKWELPCLKYSRLIVFKHFLNIILWRFIYNFFWVFISDYTLMWLSAFPLHEMKFSESKLSARCVTFCVRGNTSNCNEVGII